MPKTKSFGQFDQGEGQRYARRRVNPNPQPPKPESSGRSRAVRKLGERVYSEPEIVRSARRAMGRGRVKKS